MTEQSGTVVVPSNRERLSKLASHLQLRAKQDEGYSQESALEIQAGIAVKVLDADSIDDIFEANKVSLPGGRDLVDVEQEVTGFEVKAGGRDDIKSELTGNTYLIVSAIRLDTGEFFNWDTQSPLLVSTLIALERKDAFPVQVVIRGKQTANGTALRFERVPRRSR